VTESELRAAATHWHQLQVPAVVVQVLAHQGSVPRETGTRMVVGAQQVLGTIGGGQLELQAIHGARAWLAAGSMAEHQRRRVALGPSLGQCCGGVLELGFTPLALDGPADWPQPQPMFRLQLYGAGHVGRAIVHLLGTLPCEVQWIDERDSEFPQQPLPPHIRQVCVEPVQAEVDTAAPGDFYLVLTHSHDLDLLISRAILQRGDFGYFGLIGSATKRAKFERRLQQRGVSSELLARMVCPIGISGISGISAKVPEVLALAVVAQLLQRAAAAGSAATHLATPVAAVKKPG